MGVITDLESLCNGTLQNVDQGTRLINEIMGSGRLDSSSIEEMENMLRLFTVVRSSMCKFQHGMTFEKRFEEFE